MEPKKQEYKIQGNIGLFDDEQTLEKLNDMGNPLDRLSGVIDFEMFRDILEKALHKDKMTKAGAKPYDPVLMFKILVLQRMYHLRDAQTEYQIRDRLSFRNFLGLASGDRIPDQNTVWLFREELVRKNVFEQLFQKFYAFLEANNLIMKEGVIVDGSFVEVPRQRNSREENKKIKEDKGGELWNAEEGDTEKEKKRKANKKRHKDIDARWTKKGGEKHYGYKNHTKADAKSKLIKKCVTTAAKEHDSKPVRELVDESDTGQDFLGDSAYIGKGVKRVMRKFKLKDRVIKRNVKGKKISKRQDTINRKNSKTRVRVEHIFGFCEQSLSGMFSRAVGFARNAAFNTHTCMVYNMCRYEQILRLGMN